MAGVAAGEIASRTGRHVDNFAFFLMTGWFVALVAGGAVTHYRAEAERFRQEIRQLTANVCCEASLKP